MQFQVPQFIDVEDKIFGPLTFKQFIYLLGGAGGTFIIYKIVPNFYLALAIASPIIGLALAMAFYKFNDRPFVFVMESAFRYLMASKLFLWKKSAPDKTSAKTEEEANKVSGFQAFNSRVTSDKLKDLSWSLDVHENIARR